MLVSFRFDYSWKPNQRQLDMLRPLVHNPDEVGELKETPGKEGEPPKVEWTGLWHNFTADLEKILEAFPGVSIEVSGGAKPEALVSVSHGLRDIAESVAELKLLAKQLDGKMSGEISIAANVLNERW